jgi:hypothetical protein
MMINQWLRHDEHEPKENLETEESKFYYANPGSKYHHQYIIENHELNEE